MSGEDVVEDVTVRRFALLIQLDDGSTATIYSEDVDEDARISIDREEKHMEDWGGRIIRTMLSNDFTLTLGKFTNAQLAEHEPGAKQSSLIDSALDAAKARTRS